MSPLSWRLSSCSKKDSAPGRGNGVEGGVPAVALVAIVDEFVVANTFPIGNGNFEIKADIVFVVVIGEFVTVVIVVVVAEVVSDVGVLAASVRRSLSSRSIKDVSTSDGGAVGVNENALGLCNTSIIGGVKISVDFVFFFLGEKRLLSLKICRFFSGVLTFVRVDLRRFRSPPGVSECFLKLSLLFSPLFIFRMDLFHSYSNAAVMWR